MDTRLTSDKTQLMLMTHQTSMLREDFGVDKLGELLEEAGIEELGELFVRGGGV